MAIIWNKLIPRWDGLTIEPPEAKKDVGYIAGDKPPAKWENWLRKGTYEALDETRDVIEGIDSQLAQIEYQTPIIVGTQIRLTKQSDSNRLFFKLETDLVGNITISLDGGATEKPLNDFEGVQLTSLDKGFVEVVAQATFFTLVEKGALKISGQDVITGILQGTIDKFDAVYGEFIAGDLLATKLNNPSGLPSANGLSVSFSQSGDYLALGNEQTSPSPRSIVYKRSGNSFASVAILSQSGTGKGIAFGSDDNYIAVAHPLSPFVTIHKRDGDIFTKLANPSVLPSEAGQSAAFSHDGAYLAIGHDSPPYVTIYKRSGDVFTKLANPSVLPASQGLSVSFSSDGSYLAVAHATSPFLTIYKRNGDIFTKLANPDILPAGAGKGIAFGSDDNYIAVAHDSTPFFTVYRKYGDVFTKLANPSVLPSGNCKSVMFAKDGNYLSLACTTYPYLALYNRNGDIFTKLANPSVLPAGVGNAVSFGYDDGLMAVAHATSPFLTVYQVEKQNENINIVKSNNINELQDKFCAGYLKKGGNLGDTREMVRIFK